MGNLRNMYQVLLFHYLIAISKQQRTQAPLKSTYSLVQTGPRGFKVTELVIGRTQI